jgi:hypothetical protein
MKKTIYLKGVTLGIILTILFSCTRTADINNEKDVIKNIQGTWIAYENIGNMFRHIKLNIVNETFEAWMQTSDSKNEPIWAKLPDEKGSITLSSLQNDAEKKMKFRKFCFTCSGRCCGDKSSLIKDLSNLISYDESKGLTIDHKVEMLKN